MREHPERRHRTPRRDLGSTVAGFAALFVVLSYLHAGPPAKNGGDVVSSVAFAAVLAWLLWSYVHDTFTAAQERPLRRGERIGAIAAGVALVTLPAVWLASGLSPVHVFLSAATWAVTGAVFALAFGLLLFLIAIVGGRR